MALTKITQEDTNNKGVIGLPDTPNLSTQAMQEKFDELALDVIVPKHNGLIDELEAETAAASLGAVDPLGEATTIQAMLDRQAESGYTKAETDALLSNKVDTEVGKGLSTYDFSEAYKTKLNGIEDNANNYVLPPATHDSLGGIKPDNETITVDVNGFAHAVGGGGGGGTNNYEALINLPLYNGKVIFGDQPSEYYGVLRPYIKVTSDAGSTVTITKGTETITLTQVSGSSTEWEGHPTSYGTWTVKSVLAGADDATTTVTVDAVKTYAVTVSHISATITVTYPVGSTYCKLSKGALEYTATQNPQTFTVRSIGTWNIEVEYNGVVKTATAIISADGDSQSVTIEYATLTVNYGNDFKGKTITCTDGDLTYTKVAPNDASSISFTIPTTGTWAVSATVGGTPYSVSQVVSAYTTYTVTLEVFSATVTITFPYSNGATCTISDGDTTLTATESPMAFNIPNTGTWTATCTLDGQSKTQSFVITTDGQTESHTFEYGTINLTFDNEFRGLNVTCVNGGTVISKTAPISGNTMVFYPPSTGTWTISGTYSGVPYSTSATVVSLSTAVPAILQTAVVATVTLHGAAGAVITYTDVNGLQTQTLDNTGSKANVSITVAPTKPFVVFEDSTVSKNPADLTANFKKSVVIKSGLTDIYVTPPNSLYWYGYKSSNEEDCTSANGWNLSSQLTTSTPTYYTNYIGMEPATDHIMGIGSVAKVGANSKTVALAQGVSGNNGMGSAAMYTSKDSSQGTIKSATVTLTSLARIETETLSSDGYAGFVIASGSTNLRKCKLSALWTISSSDYNFYSAANDVVTYKDANNNDIVFAITDENGGAYIDYTALPSGSYTLTSSVAKNPSDLTADYSKTVSITNATTEVYVMPDGVIYWYGYKNNFSGTLAPYFSFGGYSNPAVTETTNAIQGTSPSNSSFAGFTTANAVDFSNYTKVHTIGYMSNVHTYAKFCVAGSGDLYNNPSGVASGTITTTLSHQYIDVTSITGNYKPLVYSAYTPTNYSYNALWLE